MQLIEELKDSLRQGTGWLVLGASFVAKAAPEIEAAGIGMIDQFAASFEQLRQIGQELATYGSMAWIGLPAKLREMVNDR